MCVQAYSRDFLITLKPESSNINTLTVNECNNIRELGIKRRYRGNRGKLSAQRRAHFKAGLRDNNCGAHAELLRPLCKETISYNNDRYLIIGTVNARSIRNKTTEYLTHVFDEKYDICTITETWLQDEDSVVIADLNSLDYNFKGHNRSGRIGGGVGILCKKQFQIKEIERPVGEYETFEYGLWKVQVSTSSTLTFVVIYRPPDSAKSITSFLDELSELYSYLAAKHKNIILSGDINIHTENREDYNKKCLDEFLVTFGLVQHITSPTHTSGHTLDVIINDESDNLLVTELEDGWTLSDHHFVKARINLKKPDIVRKQVKLRKIKNIDEVQWKNDLDKVVADCMTIESPQELFDKYNSDLASLLDKHAPVITKTITERPTPPWLDEEIIHLKQHVRKAERALKHNNNVNKQLDYKELKAVYRKTLKKKKNSYINEAINECGNNTKKLYGVINKLIGRVKTNPLPESKDDKELAETFSTFFSEKIEKIRAQLDSKPIFHPRSRNVPELGSFKVLSEDEVSKLMSKTKPTTCVTDPLPSNLLVKQKNIVLPLITRIVNTSLQTACFSASWKNSVILPLIKKDGLEAIPANYRPVNNLPYISKIVEKAMLSQVNKHMDDHRLLPDYMSAYRPGYCTETALLKVCNDILCNMDKQHITALIAVDLSAAFDTVHHGVLIEVLSNLFGLNETAREWMVSYLEGRTTEVQINATQSERRPLPYSVPQGSCAGPTLYNIYASTLQEHILPFHVNLMGYADDHAAYDSFASASRQQEDSCMQNIQGCLEEVRSWMSLNRLKMNDSKTESILFGSNKQLEKITTKSVKVAEEEINTAPSIKYLGVELDENLNFKRFVKTKCKKASYNLKNIKGIRPYLSKKSTEQLVNSLVTSHLDYANSLLAGLPNATVKPLQRIQNQAAKTVLQRSRDSSSTMARFELHWLPISERVKFKSLCIAHKCINGNAPTYLSEVFVPQAKGVYNMRGNKENVYTIPRMKYKTFGDRSFSVCGPREWNILPCTIRDIKDFNTFKKKLKTHLFREAYYEK
jgi:hypothetical protein